MSKLIEEIASSFENIGEESYSIHPSSYEGFTKAIIDECIKSVENRIDYFGPTTVDDIKETIKNHFGKQIMNKKYNSVQEMLNDTSPEFAKEFKAHMDNPIVRIKKWLMIKWAVIRSKYLENNDE